ncbi:putative basic-leucine zipper transcription factor F isoform X1 [Cucumis melo var. makuwa]|uniref:Basic-leucine zipper transcription factor F isoform X1 n=2 Tax=Cucumis melo TaxID=3656 RepID=A0A5A7SKM0_CUCMM|nr:putative basic-leucine zipper transcription factor F isoform X1 [Cucumis melo var. makuwa]TYK30394.1 putative basic-leucine zipper transcription factor F isoform X1 [Cucumis melo var. makuwa]
MIRPPVPSSQQVPNSSLANSGNGFQNQAPFCNPNPHFNNLPGNPVPTMPPPMFQPGLMMNLQNPLMGLPNNPLGASPFAPGHMGFANSASNFPAQGQFNLMPNVNQMNMNSCLPLAQFFGQNMPNLVQQLGQNMGLNNGQFCLPFQNMNQHVIPGQMMNMSQVPSHTSYGGPNQQAVPMPFQNPGFSTAQPFGVNQGMHPVNQNPQNFIPQAMGGSGSNQFPASVQPLQGNSTMPINSSTQPQQARNLQSPAFAGTQGNSSISDGGNGLNSISNNSAHRNFMRNSKKGFQKNQTHHMKNEKKRFGFPGGQKEKGFHNERRNKFCGTNSTDQVKEQKRSLSLVYTDQEIRQWREARRKNYPSSTNIQKKLAEKQTNCTLVNQEAQLLRQELKEILAKQAELGVEVAEIPPEYLSYSEKHDNRKQRGGPSTLGEEADGASIEKEKSQNRLNKRGRLKKKNRPRKKGKFEKHLSNKPPLKKREPTLLQKLLKADVRKDKSQLLQALRFMVMNSFFKEWPNKPLKFPSVTVKENEGETNVVDETPLSTGNFNLQETNNNSLVENNGTHDINSDNENDIEDSDNDEKLKGDGTQVLEEEGEIID